MPPPTSSSSDADRALVESVLARTPCAFERLVEQYQGLCWHIVNRMVRNPEDTRELCQETFLRVHLRLHQYRFESPLKAWIGQVAYSIALRHLSRKRIKVVDAEFDDNEGLIEQASDEFDLEEASVDADLFDALHAAIDALPPLQRTVLTMYHFDELSIDEIAGITEIPAGTIKSHLFRSRALLRKRMEAKMGLAV
jgi:RNA polymerase sigma factor (sigma-70 family)